MFRHMGAGTEGVGLGLGLGEGDGLGLGDGLGEGDGLGLGDGLGEGDGLGLGDGLGEGDGVVQSSGGASKTSGTVPLACDAADQMKMLLPKYVPDVTPAGPLTGFRVLPVKLEPSEARVSPT